MPDTPDELLAPAPRRPSSGLRLGALLALAVLSAYAAQHVIEMRHGANWYNGAFVQTDFRLPEAVPVVRTERLLLPFALAQGSGSLRVRATVATLRGGARAIRSVRVECGDDIVPGVTVRVEVTDYSLRTGDDDSLGHISLQAVETAADGEHTHNLELRADGLYLDPSAPAPRPQRASRDSSR